MIEWDIWNNVVWSKGIDKMLPYGVPYNMLYSLSKDSDYVSGSCVVLVTECHNSHKHSQNPLTSIQYIILYDTDNMVGSMILLYSSYSSKLHCKGILVYYVVILIYSNSW